VFDKTQTLFIAAWQQKVGVRAHLDPHCQKVKGSGPPQIAATGDSCVRGVCICVQGDKSVSPSVKSPLNNSGGGASGGNVTPSSSASLKGFSKSAVPPSLG